MENEENAPAGVFKKLLIGLGLFAPIWFNPIRAAPLQSHVTAWAAALLVAATYYVCQRHVMPVWHKALILDLFSLAIGIGGVFSLCWSTVPDVGDEGKLVSFYFLVAIGESYFLTHRRTNGLGCTLT